MKIDTKTERADAIPSSDLLACPFCGGRPEMRRYSLILNIGLVIYFRCSTCWAQSGLTANTSYAAAQIWNQRQANVGAETPPTSDVRPPKTL